MDMTDHEEGEMVLIASPGWPGKYANNAKCLWNVVVQTGFVVIVQIFDFQLEYPNDYLQIGKKTNNKQTNLQTNGFNKCLIIPSHWRNRTEKSTLC